VCPWCYIGKRNLDSALRLVTSSHPDVKVAVAWHPFLLVQPDAWRAFGDATLTHGVDKIEFYDKRFGKDVWKSFLPRLEAAFASSGVDGFTMAGKTGPTQRSHRLLSRAAQLGAAQHDALAEQIFRAYFVEGKPLCSPAVLREAAERARVTACADALDAAPEPDEAAEFQAELEYGRSRGVTGVPHFFIEGESSESLGGAQPPADLARSILRAAGVAPSG
jgi:predicted DsbA family dithiol-disulfide isomerase